MSINFDGLIIGALAFLTIGLFHPIIIKTEYHFGTKPWWLFLCLGILGVATTLYIDNYIIRAIMGVLSFCLFWSVLELFELKKRVEKGWFPHNPKRKY